MTERKPFLLIVDDEDYTCNLLEKLIKKKGFSVIIARNGEDAIDTFKKEVVDLTLLDQRMPGMNGLDVLKTIKSLDTDAVVVMMTGYGTIREAVEAMKFGAYYYMTKPFNDLEEIEIIVDRALKERELLKEVSYLRKQMEDTFSFNGVVGRSASLKNILNQSLKVAVTDSNILLQGESGTGKELIARVIHQKSIRAGSKFIPVDCGAIPETLLESILFGFQKGAFTGASKTTRGYFEDADGGTLFLDEISETSPKFQSSMLRVIQEKEFSRLGDNAKIKTDLRLITATNKDLKKEVEKGNFRDDLYYRICVVPILIPPLRERREDIPLLAAYMLDKFNRKFNRKAGPFAPEVLSLFERAEWKGNIRELGNVIERVVAMKEDGKITLLDVPQYLIDINGGGMKIAQSARSYREEKELFEKRYIEGILKKTGGNITAAAIESGIKRQNLYYKMKKYGIRY